MREVAPDQAAGLRELLRHAPARAITVACAQAGESSALIAANLAAALRQQGRAAAMIDWSARGGRALQTIEPGPEAARLPPMPEQAPVVHAVRAVTQRTGAVARALQRHAGPPEIVLLAAAPDDPDGALAASELVLVLGPDASSLTEGYRYLKRLVRLASPQRVLIMLSGPCSRSQADRIFGNLSATCKRFLDLAVEYGGAIPDDERIRRAWRLRQTVMEAYPESEAARAFRACAETLCRVPLPGADDAVEPARRLIRASRVASASS